MPIKFHLSDLELDEVSLVDAGDNPPARVVFYKDAHGELPVEDEVAENVEVDGNDLYVLSSSGVVYLIQDYTVEGDQISGSIVVLYDPHEEEEPVAPVAPAPALKSLKSVGEVNQSIELRAQAIASRDGISYERALGKLAKTAEGRALRQRLDEVPDTFVVVEPQRVHPLEELAKGSSALAKLMPAIQATMRRERISWEQALGRVKQDTANHSLVEAYRQETRAS